MYVCVCNAVTDKDIIQAAENGASSLKDLRNELNVATCCGRCATCAKGLLRQCNQHDSSFSISQ
jgi:bacterioferritin-associated ferredoxin